MEKNNFEISLKNIPNTKKQDYFVKLVLKTECLLRQMRWKAFFSFVTMIFLEEPDFYCFKSLKTAQFINQLYGFENDL